MSRHYYFGNIDLLQDFPEEQSLEESKGNFGAQSKYHYDTYNQKFDLEPYEPKDLGVLLFETMKNEYKHKMQHVTNDPKVLYQFWLGMSKAKLHQPRVTKVKPPSMAQESQTLSPNLNKKMTKHNDEKKVHKQNLDFYLQCDKRDAQFTISKFAKDEDDDMHISNAFKETQRRADEQKEQSIKNDKRKSQQKDVLERLYPQQGFEKETSDEQKTQQKRMGFMRDLITAYKFQNLNDDNFRKPEILYPFWQVHFRKQSDGGPKEVQEEIELYFQERCEIILELFYKKNGYNSEDTKVISTFWKKFVNQEDKVKYQINMESERNIEELMGEYLKQRKDQDEIASALQSNIMKNKEKDHREKLAKQVLKGKIVKATTLDKMAKAKDRMIVGKTLLELKKMHPDDKVLTKMLLQEFQETKYAKHPLEYDIVDSDEENKIKLRHSSQKGGMIMNLEDLDLPDKMKAEDLAVLFDKHLNEFYSQKNKDLRKHQQDKKDQQMQDKSLRRYIEKGSEKYLILRKRRFEEKVRSLNEYLSGLYKDCLRMYKEATNRNFPHKTYGESKRLRKRSFPSPFKRYFFACMKAFVKRKYANVKDQENRLAFWVPTNQQGRSTVNQRVLQQTKTTKEDKINADKPETSVWDKEGFTKERQKIMMTYSDAKECTFQPMVCYRMPNRLKKQMRDTHNWAPTFIDKRGKFENFLKKFGQNFNRFPKIYKYGIYQRAQQLLRRNEYVSAYKLIAEHFDLPAMKKEFDDPNKTKHLELNHSQVKKHPIFDYQKMGIEKDQQNKLPPEDFKDESNKNFLLEIYKFIKNLEKFEFGLEKTKQNLLKVMRREDTKHRFSSSAGMDQNQSTYASRKNMIKDQMCPLGQTCPSTQQRWPNSNVKGVTPLGADCMFAHHVYELKFSKELKEKRRILQDVLKKLNDRLSGEQRTKPFNPGGAQFSDCIGCGENLGSKGNKGICGFCQMRKYNTQKLKLYQDKANKVKHRYTTTHSFRIKNRERTKVHESLNRKMGCLARASALCAKERYSEAFKVIIEAVQIIKQELEVGETSFSTKNMRLKMHLGLDKDMEITAEQVFRSTLPENFNPEDIQEPQKLHMFASQMGLINNNPPDVNEFVNLQVERMYLRIEDALQSYVKDIDMMKIKIEKLEDENDLAAKTKKSDKKTKMCPDLVEKGHCDVGHHKCQFAHNAIELDLVTNEKKIDSLGKSIKKRTEDLKDSKALSSWVSSGLRGSDSYQHTQDRDRDADIKRLRQQPKTGLTKARSFKDHHQKSIFDKDIEDLKVPIDQRSKKAY